MARVLLINPPSPERLGAPLLGQQYVAASLLAAGHEVKVIDAAARYHHPSPDEIITAVEAFRPHLTGMGLFTRWAWHAYRLARALRGRGGLLVAGGAHPTVLPNEPLEHGFDLAVAGEAEDTILALAGAAESGRPWLSRRPGLSTTSTASPPPISPSLSTIPAGTIPPAANASPAASSPAEAVRRAAPSAPTMSPGAASAIAPLPASSTS